MLQLTLSCAVREWFVVAQPSSNTEGFPVRTSCPEPKTPSGELLEPRQIRPLMATNTKHLGLSDQLAESVQNGPWHPPMASRESLASRGASTEASAEAAVEFADQNTMQGPISDQQNIAHTEDQQLLEAAMTPLPASPVTATISTPSKSSDIGPNSRSLEATPALGSIDDSAQQQAVELKVSARRELKLGTGVPGAVDLAGGGSFMASPSTGAGILLTGPTSTPDRSEKSDGGQLAEQQQQQHDAADLRITRLEADVSDIKESIVTQSGSMTQMMAMMQLARGAHRHLAFHA